MMSNVKKTVLTLVCVLGSAHLASASTILSETTGWTSTQPTTFTLVDSVDGTLETTLSEKLGVFTLKRKVQVFDASNTKIALITKTAGLFASGTVTYFDVVDGVATFRFSTDTDNQIVDSNGTVIALISSETDADSGVTTVKVIDATTDDTLATRTSSSDETTVDGQAPYTYLLSSQPVFDRIADYRAVEYSLGLLGIVGGSVGTYFGVKFYRDRNKSEISTDASASTSAEPVAAAAAHADAWMESVQGALKTAGNGLQRAGESVSNGFNTMRSSVTGLFTTKKAEVESQEPLVSASAVEDSASAVRYAFIAVGDHEPAVAASATRVASSSSSSN